MMTITATGFIPQQPELLIVGDRHARRCEVAVVDSRWISVDGTAQRIWERVVFVAWDEQAEKLASILEIGSHVCCTGLLETHHWTDKKGNRRSTPRYRLTAWSLLRKAWKGDMLEVEKSTLTGAGATPSHVTSDAHMKIKKARARAQLRGHGGTAGSRASYSAAQESGVGVGR
jgi:single-stranded DNA-binding protein